MLVLQKVVIDRGVRWDSWESDGVATQKKYNAKACIVSALSMRLCGKKIREEKDEGAG